MEITFKGTIQEFQSILALRDTERDGLRNRIAQLENEPLRFSLENLAREVLDGDQSFSLTPDQRNNLRDAIRKGV